MGVACEIHRCAREDNDAAGVTVNSTFVNGFILGWSVAWPPGPINAEMIRRSLLRHSAGGGFWSAWPLGLGACCGDFTWALGVSAGAGALMNSPKIRFALGIVSLVMLLFLAWSYGFGAWKEWHQHRTAGLTSEIPEQRLRRHSGYVLGFILALMSPFNIGFWLAVVGSQQQTSHTFTHSLALAGSVVLGAIAWSLVLCLAVKQGARIFAQPSWQIFTQALTSVVMIYFAVRLVLQLR